jgi:peptidase C25-like protein/fibronectin type III domain protein
LTIAARLSRLLLACLSLFLVASEAHRRADARPGSGFQTILVAPSLTAEPSPVVTGSVRLHLQGFGVLSRPGAPAVPVRIEKIGIPEGATPRLRILRVKSRALADLRVEPVPVPASTVTSSGQEADESRDRAAPIPRGPVFQADARIYGRNADYPAAPVSLGRVGRLRDQRYVELIHTPVQVNPASEKGKFAEEVELEVSFEGASEPALDPGKPKQKGASFEKIYNREILNYQQAAPFRLRTAPLFDSTPRQTPESGGIGTTYKVSLHQDGIYRITCSSAPSCSVPTLLGQNPNTFQLLNRGVEVPMRVLGGGDNSFDVGDVLEFYGQLVKEPFTIPNCSAPADPGCATPIYEYNDTTDVNVYLLQATASTARLRMATLDGTPGGLTAEPDFLDTAHAEVNDRFLPLGDHDPFYWIPTLVADASTPAARDISVPLPGISGVSFAAAVTARLRGVTTFSEINPDHRTRITLNGVPGTTTTQDWDGEIIFDHTTSASSTILTNPSTLHLEVPAVATLNLDQVIADYVEITYRRLFQAVSDSLRFDFSNQAAKFSIGGFSGGSILAYDLSRTLPGTSDTVEPRLIVNTTPGAFSVTFQVAVEGAPTGPKRRFLAVGPGGLRVPDSVTPMTANNLLDASNEADYIIISHPSLIDATPGGAYDQFVSYLQNVRGLKVRLVFIGDIYDTFNDSLEHPEAIREFLAYAHDHWTGPVGTSPPPSYLLLVGDAVWDFKNSLNRGDWVDLVPTPIMFYDQAILKYHSSDNWLASFLGSDQSADILHGRLPVRSAAQANTVFAKILGYSVSAPSGSWRSDGYFLADVGNNVFETQTFEDIQNEGAAHFQPPWTFTKQYYAQPPYNAPQGGCNCTPTQFTNDFVTHWNTAHPAIAAFTGHGGFDILGNDFFFRPADVPLLTNGSYLPFFINSDCLTGGFHAVGVDSIGEAFLDSPSGGAVGFFAPAGLSFGFIGQVVNEQLYDDLFSAARLRETGILTANVRSALYQQGSIVDMQGYTFLGDPAMELVLPAPIPPASFQATAGNGRVDLSWTVPGPPAAGTNIYRTQILGQPYTKANATPVTGTAYADLSVTNGTTYFYYAVSVDAAGFEGAVTNTNEDCGSDASTDGPQCRRAIPKNLVPPVAVQGVQAEDTGTGVTLDVSWLANPEADIARYRVRFGTSPGSHPNVKDAGPATSTTLFGLSVGTTYYLVVSAENTSGVEGPPSSEILATPHLFQGIAPPRTIKDLMITRNGAADLLLTWSAVTTNIIGGPASVDHYNVYRGNSPTFVPSTTNRIAVVAATSSPSYLHSGGALLPDDGYYLVSAIDLDGFASGLGSDLPAGVQGLLVQASPTAGMLRISWPAVTTTVSGGLARIDHYTLYGSTGPLPRRLIGPGSLLLDNLTGPFIDVPIPSSGGYFYNLVVVDSRGNLSPY